MVADDFGMIHFKNASNGKYGSYSANELDAHLLREQINELAVDSAQFVEVLLLNRTLA